MTGHQKPFGGPIFILCCPRSGSSLLARLLGMHDDIVAPAETNLSVACQYLLTTAETLANDAVGDPSAAERADHEALIEVRRVANRLISRYLVRAGKPIYCDKSLPNDMHAELLARLFPTAKFICLYRHCLDVADSLIEASPWGFDSFGSTTFIARSPGSFVTGLSEMWMNVTDRQLAFAEQHPSRVVPVRYEDLTVAPKRVMTDLLSAIGLPVPDEFADDRSDLEPVLIPRRTVVGPSDFKLPFTASVLASAIERGRRVPVAMLPDRLREAVNERLTKLGYQPIDEQWNLTPRVPANGNVSETTAGLLHGVVELLEARITQATPTDSRVVIALEDVAFGMAFDFGERMVRPAHHGDPAPLYLTSVPTLLGIVHGWVNLGTALRRGDMRLCQTEAAQTPQVEALLSLLSPSPPDGSGVARRAGPLGSADKDGVTVATG